MDVFRGIGTSFCTNKYQDSAFGKAASGPEVETPLMSKTYG